MESIRRTKSHPQAGEGVVGPRYQSVHAPLNANAINKIAAVIASFVQTFVASITPQFAYA